MELRFSGLCSRILGYLFAPPPHGNLERKFLIRKWCAWTGALGPCLQRCARLWWEELEEGIVSACMGSHVKTWFSLEPWVFCFTKIKIMYIVWETLKYRIDWRSADTLLWECCVLPKSIGWSLNSKVNFYPGVTKEFIKFIELNFIITVVVILRDGLV